MRQKTPTPVDACLEKTVAWIEGSEMTAKTIGDGETIAEKSDKINATKSGAEGHETKKRQMKQVKLNEEKGTTEKN